MASDDQAPSMPPDGESAGEYADGVRRARAARNVDAERRLSTAGLGADPQLASANERLQWDKSDEHKQAFRIRILVGFAVVAILIGHTTYLYFLSEQGKPPSAAFPATIVTILLCLLFGYWAIKHESYLRQLVRDRIRLGIAQELRREEENLARTGTDFDSLWAATQKRIDFYHDIATEQSQRSFKSGQRAAYGGFAVLAVVGVAAAFAVNTVGAVVAGAIGLAGTGLSAYISSTFMKSHETASQQLRATFLQPVEFSRVLAAERLISQLDSAVKGKAAVRIIESMTRGQGPASEPQ